MLGTVGVICVHCFIGQVSPVLFLCSLFPNRRFFDDFLITNAGFFFASRLEPPDEQRDLIDHVGIGRVGRGCQFRVFTKLSQDVEARLNLVINWCWIRFRHKSMVACLSIVMRCSRWQNLIGPGKDSHLRRPRAKRESCLLDDPSRNQFTRFMFGSVKLFLKWPKSGFAPLFSEVATRLSY